MNVALPPYTCEILKSVGRETGREKSVVTTHTILAEEWGGGRDGVYQCLYAPIVTPPVLERRWEESAKDIKMRCGDKDVREDPCLLLRVREYV